MRCKEVLVLGGGLGGLTTAALLSAKGHRVTLVEKNAWLGGKSRRLTHHGVVIDTGPALVTFPEVWEGVVQTWRAAFPQLASQITWPRFLRLPGLGLYRHEHYALTLPPGPADPGADAFAAYAARYAPLGPLLSRLLQVDPRDRRAIGPALRMMQRLRFASSMHAWMRRSEPLPAPLGELIAIHALNAGAGPRDVPSLYGALPAVMADAGVFVPEGGVYRLVQTLVSLLEAGGVQIRTGCAATRIEGERVNFDSGQTLRADAIVSNLDPVCTERLLSEPASPSQRPRREKLSCSVMAFHGAVDPAQTAGWPLHQVIMPADSPSFFAALGAGAWPATTMAFLHHHPLGHPANPDPHHATLAVLLTVPAGPSPPEAEAFVARQLRRIERLTGLDVAALDPHRPGRAWVAPPLALTPAYYGAFGHPSGALYGQLHPPHRAGPFHPVPTRHPRHPLLFRVGAGIHPGGGIPAVLAGARGVAAAVHAHLVADARPTRAAGRSRRDRSPGEAA